MKDLLLLLRDKLAHLLRLDDDAAEQSIVVDGIRSGVEFRGAKLWILVLAIFVASLGLNTNSAAVIIGAMLISPLMGPIIGMGMGLGIYDSELLKRSFRNYIIATLFSVMTATVYFLITPFSEVQSELLARTSPTIYDVLIALCGGLAGIIALGSKSQRTGNVIPGVAIATALMPPLCTVGFGIATANWAFAAGALYLFVINTIFIASATFVGAKWIMRFQPVAQVDKVKEKRTRGSVMAVVLLTIIPAIFLTISLVRESYFKQQANRFVQTEMRWAKTQVISHKVDFSQQSINVVLIGEEVDSVMLASVKEKMRFYGLEDVNLQVVQTSFGLNEEEFQAMLRENNTELQNHESVIAQQRTEIVDLQHQLEPYKKIDNLSQELYSELVALYPSVSTIRFARGTCVEDTVVVPQTFIQVVSHQELKAQDRERMSSWIKQRTGIEDLKVHIDIVKNRK